MSYFLTYVWHKVNWNFCHDCGYGSAEAEDELVDVRLVQSRRELVCRHGRRVRGPEHGGIDPLIEIGAVIIAQADPRVAAERRDRVAAHHLLADAHVAAPEDVPRIVG